jgi:hypothetical protein
MTEGPQLVQHGSVGGTPINVDVTYYDTTAPVRVRLTQNYSIERAIGLPSRPSMTGCAVGNLDYPCVIPSGTTIAVFRAEAAALIAANAATLA